MPIPMNKTENRIIKISNWYLLGKLLFSLLFWLVLSLIFLFVSSIQVNNSGNQSYSFLIMPTILSLVLFFNYFLYWRITGIYINSQNDHIIKIGGYFFKENKLLNGVIISNSVSRNPFDQIFGTATLQVGMFFDSDDSLHGVRYKDIKNYDDQMRQGISETFTSIF